MHSRQRDRAALAGASAAATPGHNHDTTLGNSPGARSTPTLLGLRLAPDVFRFQ